MKTILITGGAKRIGAAIAQAFAKQGWDVAIHYHHSADDAEKTVKSLKVHGVQAVALQMDLAEPHAGGLVAQASNAFGKPITALVNNASQFTYDTWENFKAAQFDQHMAINLRAPLLLSQAFAKQVPDGTQGVIMNLLDQKLWALNPDFFTYTYSKVGLRAATEMLADALAPRVRVAGIAPGITLPSPKMSEENFQSSCQSTPLGYSSKPEEIASAALFIANTPSYTGDTIILDAGEHLRKRTRDVMFDKRTSRKEKNA